MLPDVVDDLSDIEVGQSPSGHSVGEGAPCSLTLALATVSLQPEGDFGLVRETAAAHVHWPDQCVGHLQRAR